MPKDEWGTKRLCPSCGTRFYDLTHDPMTCPACAHGFTAESLIAGRGRVIVAEKVVVKERDLVIDEIAEEEDIDSDAADVDLDDDLLEEDEDDNVSLDDIADVAGGEDET